MLDKAVFREYYFASKHNMLCFSLTLYSSNKFTPEG